MTPTPSQKEGYELMVSRELIAQHFLTVPDPGAEGEVHSHQYRLEVGFAGDSLDEYGYLVDIDAVNGILDNMEDRYQDALLNDLPEFEGQNPSVERFTRAVADRIEQAMGSTNPSYLTVRIWEDDDAWASHTRPLGE